MFLLIFFVLFSFMIIIIINQNSGEKIKIFLAYFTSVTTSFIITHVTFVRESRPTFLAPGMVNHSYVTALT